MTVTILPTISGYYRVSILFPTVVDRKTAQDTANDLIARAGWLAGNASWSTTPKTGKFPAQTSVEFTANTLFPNGQFPVEAFILAFRKWGEVNVMFSHGGSFQYRGQPRYENADVAVDAVPGPTSLTLHITIKNPNVQSVNLVPPLTPKTAQPAKPQRHGLPVWVWVVIGLACAACVWVLVFALLSPPEKTPGA